MPNENILAELNKYEQTLVSYIQETAVAIKHNPYLSSTGIKENMASAACIEDIENMLGIQPKSTVLEIIDAAMRSAPRRLRELDCTVDNYAALKARSSFLIDMLLDIENNVTTAAKEIRAVLTNKEELEPEISDKIIEYLKGMIEHTQ